MEDFDWTGERLTTAKTNEIMIHHLHRYAIASEIVSGKKVLDIASGEGYGSNLLSNVAREVVGVDIDQKVVDYAIKKYSKSNLTFKQGSTSSIPCANHEFDVIVSFETIEHHDEHQQMFEEFHRVLKPGGLVIISSPDKYHYSDKTNFKNPFHIKELYQKEFKEIMAREFKFTFHLNQNIYYNSIIAPDSENTSRFTEYQGSFDRLEKFSTLSIPMYNICIGSNNELDLREMALISTFNSPMLLNDLKNKEQEIYNSKTYRLGKSLTIPYRLLLRLFNK